MISQIILTLGLVITFSEKPYVDCNMMVGTTACIMGKHIVLGYNSQDIDFSLYHEIGHALFLRDDEVRNEVSKYPAPKQYLRTFYKTDDSVLNERVADYFGMYMKYPDFGTKFPELKKMFDDKTKQYQNNTQVAVAAQIPAK